jgi:HrpA-like RNA helicase
MDDDDPLDASGSKGTNFLTGRPYSDARMRWARVWMGFPVYAMKDRLRALRASVAANQVTIVVSGTGSGKTVCCPPLILKHAIDHNLPGRVAVTIPKKTTALSAAQTGAMTLDVELGREVGYQYRGAPKDSFDKTSTRLVYSTDGTLLVQARRDPMLSEYAAVIVDEAHERPVPTDMLLLAMKAALARRPEMRLIIMSATIDPAVFISYFGGPAAVGLVEVAGGTLHPVERMFSMVDSTPDNYVETGLEVAVRLLKTKTKSRNTIKTTVNDGDMLFFVATTRDASQGCRAFKQKCKTGCEAVDCAGLYSKLGKDAQADVLAPVAAPYTRKLVFATNVAESSLTMSGLTHVIDGGFELSSKWNASTHGMTISKGYASRAQILQRIGRVGRTSPGVARLLYTRKTFDALPMYPPPSILGVDMTEYALAALCGRGNENDAAKGLAAVLSEFASMITPPTPEQLCGAASFLHFHRMVRVCKGPGGSVLDFFDVPYGKPQEALRMIDGLVTPHGRWVQQVADQLKMSVWNAMLVCAGIVYGCVQDTGTLASILEATGGELSSLWYGESRGPVLRRVSDKDGDHISLLRIYRMVYLPLVASSKKDDRAEKEAMTRAGMSFGAWRQVRERIANDAPRIARIRVPEGIVDACPLYRIQSEGYSSWERALMAARMYHVAKQRKKNKIGGAAKGAVAKGSGGMLTTLAAPKRVECPAQPEFAAALPADKEGALFEQLLDSGGRQRMLTVTWLKKLPHALEL